MKKIEEAWLDDSGGLWKTEREARYAERKKEYYKKWCSQTIWSSTHDILINKIVDAGYKIVKGDNYDTID